MDFDILIGIFPQVLLDGIILGFIYALIALGYTMVYGVLEFLNFPPSQIFIIGAFVGVEILLSFKSAGWLDVLPWALVLLLVLVAGMAVSGVAAGGLEGAAAPAPPPPPAPDPADLRHRRLLLPAGRDPALRVALAQLVQPRLPDHGRAEPS